MTQFFRHLKQNDDDEIFSASNYLYKQKNPFIGYSLENYLLREFNIEPSNELFFFISQNEKNNLTDLLKQMLIVENPKTTQQSIFHLFDKEKKRFFYFPRALLNLVETYGIKVDYRKSFLKFSSALVAKWVEGVRVSFECIKNLYVEQVAIPQPFYWITGVSKDTLPSQHTETVITWLKNYSSREGREQSIWLCSRDIGEGVYDRNIYVRRNQFPPIQNQRSRIQFMILSFFMIISSLGFCMLGRWQLAFLLKEMIFYHYFSLVEKSQRAHIYFFPCSQIGFRPLWTYQAEQQGQKCICLFYASSYTLFHYNNEDVPQDIKLPRIQGASWSNIWVQGEIFRNMLSEMIENKVEIEVVGPFPFTDSEKDIERIKGKNKLLVFDIDPSDNFAEITKHGYILPYLTENIIGKFWRDLYAIAIEFSLVLCHKRKRDDPLDSSSPYTNLISSLEKEGRFYERIDSSVGSFRILKEDLPSIHLPFTSTGELAHFFGKKAAYYDAFSGINNPEQHSRGVQVLKGIDELRDWIKNNAFKPGTLTNEISKE